jgi:hypothetical protein
MCPSHNPNCHVSPVQRNSVLRDVVNGTKGARRCEGPLPGSCRSARSLMANAPQPQPGLTWRAPLKESFDRRSFHNQLPTKRGFFFGFFGEGLSPPAGQSTSPPKKRTWGLPGPFFHSHQGRGRSRSGCLAAAVAVAVAPVAITKAGMVDERL